MMKFALMTPLLLVFLIAGCTSKEQQAKYETEKDECVSRKKMKVNTSNEKYDLETSNAWDANLKADFLDASDAVTVAETTPAGRGYHCYDMNSRLKIVRHTIRTKEPSEYRAEAEAANAAFDATQQAGSAKYEKKAVRHIRSAPGVGNR